MVCGLRVAPNGWGLQDCHIRQASGDTGSWAILRVNGSRVQTSGCWYLFPRERNAKPGEILILNRIPRWWILESRTAGSEIQK